MQNCRSLPTDFQAVRGVPPWQNDSEFPDAPRESAWGYRRWNRDIGCSQTDLIDALNKDIWHSIQLVWTPERSQLLPPQEFDSLSPACRHRQITATARNFSFLLIIFLVVETLLLASLFKSPDGPGRVIVILGLLAMFGFLAEGAFSYWRTRTYTSRFVADLAENVRFHSWLSLQKKTWMYALPMALIVVWIAQRLVDAGADEAISPSLHTAALMKAGVRDGEWWRLLTAPFLHLSLIHLLGNAGMLMLLSRILEPVAVRGLVPVLTTAGFVIGGLFSVAFEPNNSAGASGAVLAMLGFLVVFNWVNRHVLPRAFVRWLPIAIGIQFTLDFFLADRIDTSAHLGGFIAGVLIAFLSRSPMREHELAPRPLTRIGQACGLLFFASAALTLLKLSGATTPILG
jgi:membrane associated rhomboid family serine protease